MFRHTKEILRFIVCFVCCLVVGIFSSACSIGGNINGFVEQDSVLPEMYINLYDEDANRIALSDVTRENYVDSVISIQNTSEEDCLEEVSAEFKGRGNGSWDCEKKKGYRIKFKNKQKVFGKTNKHWVLIACASGEDKTMFRNYLAYNMARNVFDGIEYCTSTTFIDLCINGEYQGVYVLCEHIRVGEDRVNISSEYGELDTGYLIEYDAYAEGEEGVDYFRIEGVKYPFTVHSPDPEDYVKDGKITKEEYQNQVSYIQDYVSEVYQAALNPDFSTFASLVDVDSFMDMYLLHELFKNTDTGYSSFYLYKKTGGKLYAGPAWDFDLTVDGARGDSSPYGIYVADEVEQYSDWTANELYIALYKTPEFKELIKSRWGTLSSLLTEFIDNQFNEEVYEYLKYSMARNFVRWENGLNILDAENNWVNAMKNMKAWFIARIEWLNNEWL